MPEQVPQKDHYQVMLKSSEVLKSISNDGWSDRTTPFVQEGERLLSETDREGYEEAGLMDSDGYTEFGEEIKDELEGYVKDLRSEHPLILEDGTSDVPGVGKSGIGYRQSFRPDDEPGFFYTEKAGENIGLLTNKRGDHRRYDIFTTVAGSERIAQSELNKAIDMSRGSISRILGELEEEEVVERYSPSGKNAKVVELTEYGEKLEEFVSEVENLVASQIK